MAYDIGGLADYSKSNGLVLVTDLLRYRTIFFSKRDWYSDRNKKFRKTFGL